MLGPPDTVLISFLTQGIQYKKCSQKTDCVQNIFPPKVYSCLFSHTIYHKFMRPPCSAPFNFRVLCSNIFLSLFAKQNCLKCPREHNYYQHYFSERAATFFLRIVWSHAEQQHDSQPPLFPRFLCTVLFFCARRRAEERGSKKHLCLGQSEAPDIIKCGWEKERLFTFFFSLVAASLSVACCQFRGRPQVFRWW